MRALSRRRAPEKNEHDIAHPAGENFSTPHGDGASDAGSIMEDLMNQRRIFINQPLPEELLDQDGTPLQQFSRNKIRTAKYTPLIFVPKNLWLQFHNVANIYFLFVTILAVSPRTSTLWTQRLICPRFSPSLELQIQDLVPYH
jgi:phospholipid-translocating ATPase